jgi:ORF6N domain-containing protein
VLTPNTSIALPDELIEDTILLIRGKRVILDHDLAKLYGVTTRVLNQAVKRNLDRFPEDFMLQLTKVEAGSGNT